MIMIWGTVSFLVLIGGLTAIGMVVAKYMGKLPTTSTVMPEDAAAMVEAITRMEDRIKTLERILDAEDPKWRARA